MLNEMEHQMVKGGEAIEEEKEKIIKENIPVIIDGEFEIQDLLGKILEGKYYSRNRYPIKMKRIEL